MTTSDNDSVRAVVWAGDRLRLLDQRQLPGEITWLEATSVEGVISAIRDMVVRGAPAIGIAAAYGAVLAARAYAGDPEALLASLRHLEEARPTAVNLHWAVERQRRHLIAGHADLPAVLLAEAIAIHEADVRANRYMGAIGGALIESGNVLTHCNTGSLATGGYGTALGVIRSAHGDGRIQRVYADETRPWMQGARLTAWELMQDGIPVTLLCEGAAAALLARGYISWVVVGADRIAANGDVANKIGTYGLAVLARYHGVRFMVVAPTSTIDMLTPDGSAIPIETRPVEEVLTLSGQRLAAAGADAWNPVFDVTPASLIDVIVTEAGIVEQPGTASLHELLGQRV